MIKTRDDLILEIMALAAEDGVVQSTGETAKRAGVQVLLTNGRAFEVIVREQPRCKCARLGEWSPEYSAFYCGNCGKGPLEVSPDGGC